MERVDELYLKTQMLEARLKSMQVCIHMRMYVYIGACRYVCICVCIYIYMCVCVCMCMCTRMHVYACIWHVFCMPTLRVHTCHLFTRIHTHTGFFKLCIYIYIYIYIVQTSLHIYAQTCSQSKKERY
jgi:hypothetical protein